MCMCLSRSARKFIGSANCFEIYRIFASKPRSDCVAGKRDVLSVCRAKASYTITRVLEEFYCWCRETRTSRIPFTLGNPCGYQLPEIPHTYPIRPAYCRTLHIWQWGRLAQFAVTNVFINSKHPILVQSLVTTRSPIFFFKIVRVRKDMFYLALE